MFLFEENRLSIVCLSCLVNTVNTAIIDNIIEITQTTTKRKKDVVNSEETKYNTMI